MDGSFVYMRHTGLEPEYRSYLSRDMGPPRQNIQQYGIPSQSHKPRGPPRVAKNFSCWVDKVGGVDMEHSITEADRGLCTRCFPLLKKTRNQFKVPRSRTIIVPLETRLEKEPNQKDFWYSYKYKGQTIVARDVSVGKNSPLKIYFVKGTFNTRPQTASDPQNPANDLWFSYKFGIHDFALYKWKGKGFNVDTKINKTVYTPEAEAEIKNRALGHGSGVVHVYSDKNYIYYQDLKGFLSRVLNKKGTRKRKNPNQVAVSRSHPIKAEYGNSHRLSTAGGSERKQYGYGSIFKPQASMGSNILNPRLTMAKEFSQDLFSGISPDFPELRDPSTSILVNEMFPGHHHHRPTGGTPPAMFGSRPLRSNTKQCNDLSGVRSIEGVKSANNYLEGKLFRVGDNLHTVLDTNLSSFYTEKFCGPWDFFTIFSDYKSKSFAVFSFSGPACTPLALQLQKRYGITICAIMRHKFWTQLRTNSRQDAEKAINLFVDANNTRIRDEDVLVCKVSKQRMRQSDTTITLDSKGGAQRMLQQVKRTRPDTDMHQLLRHVVLRLLGCLQVVQVPRTYHGKSLNEIGLQNAGLTVWSKMTKNGEQDMETYVDGTTKLEKGEHIVVKKSRSDANMEEKCRMFAMGELGWVDEDDM